MSIVENQNGVIRKTVIQDGKVYSQTIQDASDIAQANNEQRIARSQHQKYKGNLSHVGRIPLVFIEQMANGQCCPGS